MVKSFIKISILVIALVAALGIYQARAGSKTDCNSGGASASSQAIEYGRSNELQNGATQRAPDADTGPAQTLYSRPYSRWPSNYRYEP